LPVTHDEVRELLPAYIDRDLHSVGDVELHLAECADCRSELALYREMIAALGAMRGRDVEPSPDFLERMLELIPQSLSERARKTRLAVASIGGAAVGVTALAIVWWKLAHRETQVRRDSPSIA
jgi:predicted anti-sigma-YlaC factor YlaD